MSFKPPDSSYKEQSYLVLFFNLVLKIREASISPLSAEAFREFVNEWGSQRGGGHVAAATPGREPGGAGRGGRRGRGSS